jgi:hypothetical protein
MNNTTHTEMSAVQDACTYGNTRDLILKNPHVSKNYRKIIELLDEVDVVRALHILDVATNVFRMKFEEIKKEYAK